MAASCVCLLAQSISTYLSEINHHEGLYNKLLEVQAAYSRSAHMAQAAAATGSASLPQQQQQSNAAQQVSMVFEQQRPSNALDLLAW